MLGQPHSSGATVPTANLQLLRYIADTKFTGHQEGAGVVSDLQLLSRAPLRPEGL